MDNRRADDGTRDDEKRELWQAIADLERDYAQGMYSGGGYDYIEATPEALRLPASEADRVAEGGK